MSTHHQTTSPPHRPPSNPLPGDTPRGKADKTGPPLGDLLASFHAAELGEGDHNAGANLLAAMAVTLGNLSRPGSGIRLPSGRLLTVGTNLLATGPLVSSLVIGEVVAPVGRCQDNLLAQLTRLLKDDDAERAKTTPRRWVLSEGAMSNRGENALFQLMTGDPETPPPTGSNEDMWMAVLSEPPPDRLEDLVRRPRAFIAAPTKSWLEKLLPDAHLGDALVSIGLTRAKDAANFGDLCPSVMDGLYPGGPTGELVRGRLLVTDHGHVLREVAAAPDDRNGWLSRLVWLVEGSAGPEAPSSQVSVDDPVKLPNPNGRFEEAVRAVIAHRLNSHEPQPRIHEIDFSQAQIRWAAFLKKMEDRLPGITGTARGLLATLAFGLLELKKAPNCKPLPVTLKSVEALGRWIIRRMANARTMMLYAGEVARRRSQIERVFRKLEQGPADARKIYRTLSSLPPGECHACLRWLEQTGISRRSGDQWELVEDARLSFNDCTTPLLEV